MTFKEIKTKFDVVKGAIASFVAFTYTTVESGEVAQWLFNVSVSYKNAVKKDIEICKSFTPETDIEIQAVSELLASKVLSYRKQLVLELAYIERANNDQSKIDKVKAEIAEIDKQYKITDKAKANHEKYSNAQLNAYVRINHALKWNVSEQTLYITGFKVKKQKVLVAGEHKQCKKRPLTIAKDKYRKHFKADKIRTLKLTNFSGQMKLNGETLELS